MIQIGERHATIDTPIEHLMACHRRIEERLATLGRAAERLQESPEAALAAIRACLRFLDSNGAMHTVDEEASLFPRLRPLLSADELAYVDSLESQHRETEEVYARLKAAVEGIGSGGDSLEIAQYRELALELARLYGDHIRSEDEILTGLARRCLNASELDAISLEMRDRRRVGQSL